MRYLSGLIGTMLRRDTVGESLLRTPYLRFPKMEHKMRLVTVASVGHAPQDPLPV
jgi:hypothetical protein